MCQPKIKIIGWTGQLPPGPAVGSDCSLERQPLILWLCGWKPQQDHPFRNHAVRKNVSLSPTARVRSIKAYCNRTLSLSLLTKLTRDFYPHSQGPPATVQHGTILLLGTRDRGGMLAVSLHHEGGQEESSWETCPSKYEFMQRWVTNRIGGWQRRQ